MASVRQDVNVPLVAFVGIVSSMVLLILVLGVHAWFGYEQDLVLSERYAADRNVDWIALKAEQYANIGDDVGNDTIYGDEVPAPTRFYNADDQGFRTYADFNFAAGYRYAGEDRSTVVVPIHVAMAEFVRQHGGEVTADEMKVIDNNYVRLKNDAYADPQAYVDGRVSDPRSNVVTPAFDAPE
jgi:hypothetical protein